MEMYTESALELVRQKKHPTTEQEDKWIPLFEDEELEPEEPSAFSKLMHKLWEAASRKLVHVLVVVLSILAIAFLLLKLEILAWSALGVGVTAMAIAMTKMVRDALKK